MEDAPAITPDDAQIGIGPGEPLGHALVRVGGSCFERISGVLPPGADRDPAVHTARKAVKRARALLRLVRGAVDDRARGELDTSLRDVGRALAPVRDARVTIETLDGIAPGRCPDLREHIAGHYREVVAGLFGDPGALAHLDGETGRARERWASLVEPVADLWESIGPGLSRTHRRAVARMERSVGEPSDESFHRWRREVKYLRHQVEFLYPLDPAGLGVVAADLDRLGELLGAEHDLTVLAGLVAAEGGCEGSGAVLDAAGERKASLRTAALALGGAALGEGEQTVSRAAAAWKAAGRE